MIEIISRLLNAGVAISLVTAAGYKNPAVYEGRLRGLLDSFQLALEMGAPPSAFRRFFVMGGECNFLLRCGVRNGVIRLFRVAPELWKNGRYERMGE